MNTIVECGLRPPAQYCRAGNAKIIKNEIKAQGWEFKSEILHPPCFLWKTKKGGEHPKSKIQGGFTPLEIRKKCCDLSQCFKNRKRVCSNITSNLRLPYGDLSLTGFTLLEVLISLAIVSITLVVLIHSQLLSIRQGTNSKYYTTAIFLANEILTDTLVQENLTTGKEDDDFEDYPEFYWKREVEDTEIGGLKKVEIIISGPENTQIVLNTYWRKK